jgi:hypothetical protein
MSDTIILTLDCCDEFLDGKLATIAYTYLEPEAGYMGAWQPAAVELDAVVIGSGEYLDSLDADEQKALARRVLEAIEEGWREAEASREWDASLTDHCLAVTKGY